MTTKNYNNCVIFPFYVDNIDNIEIVQNKSIEPWRACFDRDSIFELRANMFIVEKHDQEKL